MKRATRWALLLELALLAASLGTAGPIAWIRRNAASLRHALADPEISAKLLGLLGGDHPERRREHRLTEARRELETMELRWKLGEDDHAEP